MAQAIDIMDEHRLSNKVHNEYFLKKTYAVLHKVFIL